MWSICCSCRLGADIVKVLDAAIGKVMSDSEFLKEAQAAGIFTRYIGGSEFAAFYEENHQLYKKLIETALK